MAFSRIARTGLLLAPSAFLTGCLSLQFGRTVHENNAQEAQNRLGMLEARVEALEQSLTRPTPVARKSVADDVR